MEPKLARLHATHVSPARVHYQIKGDGMKNKALLHSTRAIQIILEVAYPPAA
jgi:hypothetical protein